MSGTIQESIDHARAGADVLDDPDDIENRAILTWMSHHVTFHHHHHKYVFVTEALPLRWRTRAVAVPTKADGVALLRSFRHEHAATGKLRAVFVRWEVATSTGLCATDEGVLDILAGALAAKRIWLFRDARKPPIAGVTDPSVYTGLNGRYASKLVFARLSRWEGGQWLRGYVPFSNGVVAGYSGMTIATGFDVGQISEIELSKLGLPPTAEVELAPYAGLRFHDKTRAQVAAIVAKRGPVPVLTKHDADATDLIIFGKHLASAIASWNTRRKPNVPEFKALPAAWQTVLFSRTFQQGTGMPDTAVAKPFYTAAAAGHWAQAANLLQNYAVSQTWYKVRVGEEAAFLRTEMPPPVVAPGAAHPAQPGQPPAPPTPGQPTLSQPAPP